MAGSRPVKSPAPDFQNTERPAMKRTPSLFLPLLLAAGLPGAAQARKAPPKAFHSSFATTPDRTWIGPDYWANPMEWWEIRKGRLAAVQGRAGMNVHLLTCRLGPKAAPFAISIRAELLGDPGTPGSAGFRVGAKDEIPDYRAVAVRGKGLDCGITTEGTLFLGKKRLETGKPFTSGRIVLKGRPRPDGTFTLEVSAGEGNGKPGKRLVLEGVAPRALEGGLALVMNTPAALPSRGKTPGRGRRGRRRRTFLGARFAFRDWNLRGEKLEFRPERAFGPILWAMHTLSDSRGPEGCVLKMTAQMPPMGEKDSHTLLLQAWRGKEWVDLGSSPIHPDARTATFRVPKWDRTLDVPYRLVYKTTDESGRNQVFTYTGTIRKEPSGRPVKVAAFTGNFDATFPHLEVNRNVSYLDPDVLFFSGDQIYEPVGDYALIRKPTDLSILNYLRKWYLFGWAFRDLMRDRVTICLPDDHDVYQGNLWGEGGIDCHGLPNHQAGGYAQPVRFVNVVHRTQTSHHPDLYDPTPAARGITVYYGDMVYGRVSFAIVGDREFKSGPKGKVNTWKGRPDWVRDPKIDVKSLDKPGLKLLGDRQLAFLRAWTGDWRGADMKVVLSETIFCNLANYHGGAQTYLRADLDSNGWPQSGRNRALDVMRRGFAFHIAGDQHLASLVWHGIDDFKDAGWSFCVPSICNFYPRSWKPDKEGRPVRNRPAPGLPNTGDYLDGLENKISVYAVANPRLPARRGRIASAADKSSGFGLVRFDTKNQLITVECYRLDADPAHPKAGDQFEGWPRTISMFDNYGRKAKAWLPEVRVKGLGSFVVQVLEERTGEMVYTVRIRKDRFRPKVFSRGPCTLRVGDPDKALWKTIPHLEPRKEKTGVLEVAF